MRWLLVGLLAVLAGSSLVAADAAKPPPDIPDPYGLGPRLALIDHLKTTLHVEVAPDLSYEELVKLYWTTVNKPAAEEEAARKDRIETLQFRLKSEFHVDASDCTSEAALQDRLAQCERAATVVVVGAPATETPPAPSHEPAAKPAASAATSTASGTANWPTNLNAAISAAKASGRPILIDFCGSDWCGWCQKLDAEVFTQPVFSAWASTNVILLAADFPRTTPLAPALAEQNESLAKRYNVTGFPTVLVIAADGRVIARDGYRPGGAQTWVEGLGRRLREALAAAPAP